MENLPVPGPRKRTPGGRSLVPKSNQTEQNQGKVSKSSVTALFDKLEFVNLQNTVHSTLYFRRLVLEQIQKGYKQDVLYR